MLKAEERKRIEYNISVKIFKGVRCFTKLSQVFTMNAWLEPLVYISKTKNVCDLIITCLTQERFYVMQRKFCNSYNSKQVYRRGNYLEFVMRKDMLAVCLKS